MYYNNAQLTALAAELDVLQSAENDGRGIQCVKHLIQKMRQGNQEDAQLTYYNEADKIRQYPKVEAKLLQIFGCRLHGTKDCAKPFCQQ